MLMQLKNKVNISVLCSVSKRMEKRCWGKDCCEDENGLAKGGCFGE